MQYQCTVTATMQAVWMSRQFVKYVQFLTTNVEHATPMQNQGNATVTVSWVCVPFLCSNETTATQDDFAC